MYRTRETKTYWNCLLLSVYRSFTVYGRFTRVKMKKWYVTRFRYYSIPCMLGSLQCYETVLIGCAGMRSNHWGIRIVYLYRVVINAPQLNSLWIFPVFTQIASETFPSPLVNTTFPFKSTDALVTMIPRTLHNRLLQPRRVSRRFVLRPGFGNIFY